jgi:hypothetical protein
MTGNYNHARNADVTLLTAVPDVPDGTTAGGCPRCLRALVGRLDAQAAMFAARMRHGLLAASVAIGLEVLDQLFEAEVVELAGAKGPPRCRPDPPPARHGQRRGHPGGPAGERVPAAGAHR